MVETVVEAAGEGAGEKGGGGRERTGAGEKGRGVIPYHFSSE